MQSSVSIAIAPQLGEAWVTGASSGAKQIQQEKDYQDNNHKLVLNLKGFQTLLCDHLYIAMLNKQHGDKG